MRPFNTCFTHCGLIIWQQRARSTFVQVMARCLTVPSHYLNQFWLILSEDLWHSPEGNFTGNAQDVYPWYEFKITYSRLQPHLPGASGSIMCWMPKIHVWPLFASVMGVSMKPSDYGNEVPGPSAYDDVTVRQMTSEFLQNATAHGLQRIAGSSSKIKMVISNPDSKVHGANMGPMWGRQDPGGPHVGAMNFAIWEKAKNNKSHKSHGVPHHR